VTRPTILLAMITVGNGHRMVAEALADWIEQRHPGRFDHRVVDFTLAIGQDDFDRRHKLSWRRMLRAPWTAYIGQRLLDRVVPARLSRAVQAVMLREQARLAAAYLKSRPVDLVVATHFFTAHAVAIARERYGVDVPLVVINPDILDAHALWAEARADALVVFSEAARDDLVRHGVPADRIERFNPVLRPEFGAPCSEHERHAARRSLDIHSDAAVVLWSAGGEGIGGRLAATLDALDRLESHAIVLVLCGRNDALYHDLQRRRSEFEHVDVRPLGFRDDVRALSCAADLFVGKAGPAATFEALICGLPVLHFGFVAANEKAVADWVERQGVGHLERRPAALAVEIDRLVRDPAALVAARKRVRALGLRNGGPEAVDSLAARCLSSSRDVEGNTPR